MRKIILLTMAFMLYLTISALSQETPDGYNPFVPANLDDVNKLAEAPVVESSYHYYTINGDANYTELSTFVWYVENGEFGFYDVAGDVWTPQGGGNIIELTGETLGGVDNSSGIWVRWNDGTGNSTGYVAVYERSADNCILIDQISGFKHQILVPPEVWFLVDTREECADQIYSVTAQFNEVHDNSFPYVLTYSYPGPDGVIVQTDTTIVSADLDGSNQLHWDLNAVLDLDVAIDELYTISLDEIRDLFGSVGKIAPLGASANQYTEMTITIFHLPQTGGMIMN